MILDFSFDEENHIYTLTKTGVEVPGCTRVIDIAGWDTYKNVREDILERKSALGREVHRSCLLYDHGNLNWDSMHPRVAPYVAGWKYFRDVTGFVPTLAEYRAVCEVHGRKFGLTIDRSGMTGRKRSLDTIVELKTTVKKARRHDLQTAGYAMGLPKHGIKSALARFLSRRRLIVYLKPKGDPDIEECKEREDYDIFEHLLAITEYKLREEKIEREETWETNGARH
jgi:hypothetical protein